VTAVAAIGGRPRVAAHGTCMFPSQPPAWRSSLRRVRTARLLLGRLVVNGQEVETRYADVFVVLRDGAVVPGPNDWEVTVRSSEALMLEPGIHELELEGLDGTVLTGSALLRLSDGDRVLFRGDGHLSGFAE
jgi:hypothetical protein